MRAHLAWDRRDSRAVLRVMVMMNVFQNKSQCEATLAILTARITNASNRSRYLDWRLGMEPASDRADRCDSRMRPRCHRRKSCRGVERVHGSPQIHAQVRTGDGRDLSARHHSSRNRGWHLGGRVLVSSRIARRQNRDALLAQRDNELRPRELVLERSMATDGCVGGA